MVGKERVSLLPRLWTRFHSLLAIKYNLHLNKYRNKIRKRFLTSSTKVMAKQKKQRKSLAVFEVYLHKFIEGFENFLENQEKTLFMKEVEKPKPD